MGVREVARIRGLMDTVVAQTGYTGGFAAFVDFLRTDPRFFFERAEDLLTAYRDIAKRADPELVRLFGTLPRLPYGVRPVPAYAEKSQTTAYYEPGSPAAGRPGYFYANTYDLSSRPRWEMEPLALHEAVPGHHLQIALAQELPDLPAFRKHAFYTAYVEGWALYAESLGGEMGFYQDPFARFGQLTYEMWRAIRLVVDTGLHRLGWSRQQAIDYFVANAGKAEHDIVVEVDRYIVWPGQALAYKMGELKIKRAARRVRGRAGRRASTCAPSTTRCWGRARCPSTCWRSGSACGSARRRLLLLLLLPRRLLDRHRLWPGVARLVDAELAAAGQRHLREEAPALVADGAAAHLAAGEVRDQRRHVVAHQVELVDVVLLGRVDGHLRGRQAEDQPAVARVHAGKARDVRAGTRGPRPGSSSRRWNGRR